MTYAKNGKVVFDYIFSFFLVLLFSPLCAVLLVLTSIDTRSLGIFYQKRIGQYGKSFTLYKFKTIHDKTHKISPLGKFLRQFKVDELPQLFNILKGEMSFVGPRPDIEGYYDRLSGEMRTILELKPGLTSEASIKYRHEEGILATKKNPLKFNDEVVFPDKIKMNLHYLQTLSFKKDMVILIKTFFKILA
ncbi:MAG: sugar transferase [Bergeyella sp.]|nr:sugar transferase [Bergeyella sp.]